MTVGEHIATIRGIIRKYEDDSHFTNSFIYSLLNSAAATVNKRKADKGHKLSDWNVAYFTIGMEEGSTIGDDCLSEQCLKWKTKFKIPRPLMTRDRHLIDVRLIDGTKLDRVSMDTELWELSPVLSKRTGYYIENEYIVLVGCRPRPKAIKVGGVWEDITDWSEIKLCDSSGNELGTTCYNIQDDEFPVDADYQMMMYDLVLQKLGMPLQSQEDVNSPDNQNAPS